MQADALACHCGAPATMRVRVLPYAYKGGVTQVPSSPLSAAHRRAQGRAYDEGACSAKHLEAINRAGKVLKLTPLSDEKVERTCG